MTSTLRTLRLLLLAGVIMPLMLGCSEKMGPGNAVSSEPPTAGYKEYPINGLVVATSSESNEVTLQHGAIAGIMPAMTMAYKVKKTAVIQSLKVGDRVSAALLVSPDNTHYFLDKVVITSQPAGSLKSGSLPPHTLTVGETVPDVQLVNQDGKTIHLQDYRGKALLITFIYTRCPMPTACPRITSHFAEVYAQLATDAKASAASHLLSITLDPEYDKPQALRQYGLAYLDDNASGFAHWEFADTTPGDLKKLANAFGLEYMAKENQIMHTMQTILIGPDGKVVQTWKGSDWNSEEITKAVENAVSTNARH